MPSKIRIRLGDVEVEYEGSDEFLKKELLHLIKELAVVRPAEFSGSGSGKSKGGTGDGGSRKEPGSLANFLKSRGKPQVMKFLATAEWLHLKGAKRLETSDVTKALKSASQTRLTNASVCLSENVKNGHCEKDGNKFYVTTEGKEKVD